MVGGILIFTFLIYKLFDTYTLKEIFTAVENFTSEYKTFSYFLVFLAAVAEGTIILAAVPGSITILIFGALTVNGIFDFWILYLIVVVGAVLGDNLGYLLGRFFGPKIMKTGLVDPLGYKTAELFLQDHGGKTIAVSRFMGGMKELAPFIAGSVKMAQGRFQFFNFLGALGWALLWLGAGRLFYQNLDFVQDNFGKIFTTIGIIFMIFFIFYFKKNKERILNS